MTMGDPSERGGPTWVSQRDGRLEPFDPDRINRAIFAATEALGKPDPFLARELTDGVIHFLEAETRRGAIAAADVHDVMVKVVRELGHPGLAIALERAREARPAQPTSAPPADPRCGPRRSELESWIQTVASPRELGERISMAALEEFGLEAVHGSNLVAAHHEGFLRLGNLATPVEFAGLVLRLQDFPEYGPAPDAQAFWELLQRVRGFAGDVLAVDARVDPFARLFFGEHGRHDLLTTLGQAASALGLRAIVNVGQPSVVKEAAEPGAGQLFSWPGPVETASESHPGAIVDALVARNDLTSLHWQWHLSNADWADDAAEHRLRRLLRAFRGSGRLTFVCPRRMTTGDLGPGLTARQPALLCWVGMNLPVLRQRFGPDLAEETFLGKVRSLARLAASVGAQKRNFLRQHGRPQRPTFLLENARLGIFLITDDQATEPALYKTVRATLDRESRVTHVANVLDDPWTTPLRLAAEPERWQDALRQAGRRHELQQRGTVALAWPEVDRHDVDLALGMLRFASQSTTIHRLRFERLAAIQQQLTAT